LLKVVVEVNYFLKSCFYVLAMMVVVVVAPVYYQELLA
jgi:hypothetical protein